MTFEERVYLIKRLYALIKRKYKGSSDEYSRKLNVSRATFFRLLNYIRTGLEPAVRYNKANGYYEYGNGGTMRVGIR